MVCGVLPVFLFQLLLMAAHSFPNSYTGDVSTVTKGDAFNKMGIANYENSYSDKCKINHNVPAEGWQDSTQYSFNVTTDQGTEGLGMVYQMKYAKGNGALSGKSPTIGNNKQRVQVTPWSSTVSSFVMGDSFTVYAICGAGGSTDKMYVAEPVKLCKVGGCKETTNTSPSSSTPSADKSDGHMHTVALGALFAVSLVVLSA
eukprot:g343.t1